MVFSRESKLFLFKKPETDTFRYRGKFLDSIEC